MTTETARLNAAVDAIAAGMKLADTTSDVLAARKEVYRRYGNHINPETQRLLEQMFMFGFGQEIGRRRGEQSARALLSARLLAVLETPEEGV